MIDVLVAGGGPAGLSAAIAARQAGMSVLVVEPHGGTIDKACGEGVMPAGLIALRDLGVAIEGRPFGGIRYVHRDLSAVGAFPRGVHGLAVRRTALHDALRDRAESLGVRFERGRVTAPARAGWLIAADGLRSDVRRSLGLDRPARNPPRFGMRRHFRVAPWTDDVEVTFAPNAEAYVTPIAEDVVGVAFLFEPPARWDALLARFPDLARRLAGAEPVSSLRGAGPFERRVARRVVDRTLLVGDAAGYVDPLTGEGVALGVLTARAAVEAIRRGDALSYERTYAELTARHEVLTSALLAVARRPALHHSLVAAARAFSFAFDGVLAILSGTRGSDHASLSTT